MKAPSVKNRNGYFKSFDGTRLFYSISYPTDPEKCGPPLLFCYGLLCSKLHWQYQMSYFAKTHPVIWLDFRGHHLSEMPGDISSITIETLAHDVACLMDEIKIPQAVLLGHSMGVNIALEFCHRFPEKTLALVLANGCARAPFESLLKTNFMSYVLPLLRKSYKKAPELTSFYWKMQASNPLARWFVGWAGFNPAYCRKSDIELYIDLVATMDLGLTLQIMSDYSDYDATPWLHTIQKPSLILAGEKDLIIPREAQELMHQLIPNSQFELIRDGSHCPQMDIPEMVNILVEDFISGLTSNSGKKAKPRGKYSSQTNSV